MNQVLKVTHEEAGQRLPNFIQGRLDLPLSLKQIKKNIEQNACLVNGKVERFASYLVEEGDRIQFEPAAESTVEWLYEDDFLAVVNKPPFVVCETEKGLFNLRLAHRLDKETSGCLLLAKSSAAEKALTDLFRSRQIHKEYLAVVEGKAATKGMVDHLIEGHDAKTIWKLEKKGKTTSLLRCFPETGRTHQIRIHLSSIGHPILGDNKYGKSKFPVKRILLHSAKIGFIHPLTKKQLTIEAPTPKEFYEALNY